MTRLRLWWLRRAYGRIGRLERHLVGNEKAGELRLDFTEETIRRANRHWSTQGLSRSERKTRTRTLAQKMSANP